MKTKDLLTSSIFISFGIILPIIFHQINFGGKIFLPMLIPIIISGLLTGRKNGILVGAITPIFSSIVTGMPVLFPTAFIMLFELSVYGFFSGYYYEKTSNIYFSMIVSMFLGRITSGVVVWILIYIFNYSINLHPVEYVKISTITGVPGIIIQLLLIPIIVNILKNYIKIYQLS